MKLDHIVYCVVDLDTSINYIEKKLGMRPVIGGCHPMQGTKNALLNLGDKCYLELLAIDDENMSVETPRWMGIDLISEPLITRFALKSKDLLNEFMVLKKINPNLARIDNGSRTLKSGEELTWKLTRPAADPVVETMPFFVKWSEVHPTNSLKEGCTLIDFYLTHPQPESVKISHLNFGLKNRIEKGNEIRIHAKIKGPKGEIVL